MKSWHLGIAVGVLIWLMAALGWAQQSAPSAVADADGTVTQDELLSRAGARAVGHRRGHASMFLPFMSMRARWMARGGQRFNGGGPWTSRSRGIGRPWSGDTSAGSWRRRGEATDEDGRVTAEELAVRAERMRELAQRHGPRDQ